MKKDLHKENKRNSDVQVSMNLIYALGTNNEISILMRNESLFIGVD